MTDIQKSITSFTAPQRVASAELLGADAQPHAASALQSRCNFEVRWLVTLPVQTPQGRPGSQTFVVVACSADVAVAVALTRAALPAAQRRRRGATLQESAAVVEPWRSTDELLRAGW